MGENSLGLPALEEPTGRYLIIIDDFSKKKRKFINTIKKILREFESFLININNSMG